MRLAVGTSFITRLAFTCRNSRPRYSPVPTWRSTSDSAGKSVSGSSDSRRHRKPSVLADMALVYRTRVRQTNSQEEGRRPAGWYKCCPRRPTLFPSSGIGNRPPSRLLGCAHGFLRARWSSAPVATDIRSHHIGSLDAEADDRDILAEHYNLAVS